MTTLGSRRIMGLALGLVILGLGGCSEQAAPPPPARPVQTLVLAPPSSEGFRRFPGEVKAVESSRMSFDVPGRLVEFPATQGMVVEEGALLAQLDTTNFAARLDAATSDFTTAKEEFDRRRQLLDRGVISESEFSQFRQGFEVAEANLREAQRAMEDTRLVAPFPGRVAQTFANNFQSVQAKEPVLLFQDVSSLEIDIDVPETDMMVAQRGLTAGNARERLEAYAEFPVLGAARFPLQLESFGTQASPGTRTFPLTFRLDPPEDANVLPGMTCTVLARARRNGEESATSVGYSVPVQAVATSGGSAWIWKLDPESLTVSRVEVEPLGFSGSDMLVAGGSLSPGDEIVTTGVRFLEEGDLVSRMNPVAR